MGDTMSDNPIPPIPKNNVHKLHQFFRHATLYDVKSDFFPLPLLSYCIDRLLPADAIGFNDPPLPQVKESLSVIDKEFCTFIPTGSYTEGLQVHMFSQEGEINISDTDTFVVPKYEFLPPAAIYDYGHISEDCIPLFKQHIPAFLRQAFQTQFQTSYPGYIVMTPEGKYTPLLKALHDVPDFDDHIKHDFQSTSGFLKSKGPSLKALVQHTDENSKLLEFDADHVYAYPSHNWPVQAAKWPNRLRKSKWPTTSIVQEIVNMGVHYVKKPPENVQEEFQQYYWRVSFSIAERELAKRFNETQRQCTILLKILKLKEIIPKDVLTSYHIKTLMFWACEDIPRDYWTSGNLASCFLQMLDRMILVLLKRRLPHYFIPELNLFQGKDRGCIMHLVSVLKKIRRNPISYIGNWLAKSFLRIQVDMRKRNISNLTENYLNLDMKKNFAHVYPDLLMISIALLIDAKKKYRRRNTEHNFQAFCEKIHDLERSVAVLGIAMTFDMPHKSLYMNIPEAAASLVFDEKSITPYYEYTRQQCGKRDDNPDLDLLSKEAFFSSLSEKYASDFSLLSVKLMLPVLRMVLLKEPLTALKSISDSQKCSLQNNLMADDVDQNNIEAINKCILS